jgi:hypothetical protein
MSMGKRLHEIMIALRSRIKWVRDLAGWLGLTKRPGLRSAITDLTSQLTVLVERLDAVERRAEQLALLARRDMENHDRVEQLSAVLDETTIRKHIRKALEGAELHNDPFPHIIIEQLLPRKVYEVMVNAIPPRVFFEDRPVNKQQLTVPFEFAPEYSRRVWQFVADSIASDALGPALVDKFSQQLIEYLQGFCTTVPSLRHQDLGMHISDGRILLRRPGYVIPPHRDPKWGFITCLVYLARPRDDTAYGTQLYRLRQDADAPTVAPFYVDVGVCELVKTVPFRPNTALAFLNSSGAHGASIPADAPASVERYLYQFRVGPGKKGIDRMLSNMVPEARATWIGKQALEYRS